MAVETGVGASLGATVVLGNVVAVGLVGLMAVVMGMYGGGSLGFEPRAAH